MKYIRLLLAKEYIIYNCTSFVFYFLISELNWKLEFPIEVLFQFLPPPFLWKEKWYRYTADGIEDPWLLAWVAKSRKSLQSWGFPAKISQLVYFRPGKQTWEIDKEKGSKLKNELCCLKYLLVLQFYAWHCLRNLVK